MKTFKVFMAFENGSTELSFIQAEDLNKILQVLPAQKTAYLTKLEVSEGAL